jgi:hypothetical protein
MAIGMCLIVTIDDPTEESYWLPLIAVWLFRVVELVRLKDVFTHQFSDQHTVSHTALSSLLTYTQPINAYRFTIRGDQSSKIDHGPIPSEYDRQQQHKIMSKGLGLGL